MPRILSDFGVRMSIILPLERCNVLAEQIKRGPEFPFSDQETHDMWVRDKVSLINTYLDLADGLIGEFEVNGKKFKEIVTNHLDEPRFMHLLEWLREKGSNVFENWEKRV